MHYTYSLLSCGNPYHEILVLMLMSEEVWSSVALTDYVVPKRFHFVVTPLPVDGGISRREEFYELICCTGSIQHVRISEIFRMMHFLINVCKGRWLGCCFYTPVATGLKTHGFND